MNDDQPASPFDEPMVKISRAVRLALRAAMSNDQGMVVVSAEDAVIGLVDVLGGLLATNPACETIRGRREYAESVAKVLRSQIERYQDLRDKQLVTPAAPKLIIVK